MKIRLVTTFTNGNRRRRQVIGELVGRTPEWWVVRVPGERLNQVLEYAQWEEAE